MEAGEFFNRLADKFVCVRIRVAGGYWSTYRLWGSAALTLAALLGVVLGLRRGLPPWALLLGIGLSFVTFYAVALSTKIMTGEEGLTFYHQLISMTAVITSAAWLLGQWVLLATDIVATAVGATLTFGRIGCLMVGCCHGRPCRIGVRYGAEHAVAGFTSELVGVRLFPIQIAEFLCVIPIEIVGCLMIWNGNAPGAAAAWFIVSYCSTRFCFEFARWPPSYQFRLGLSQYQWISLVLILFTVALEFTGVLPFQLWHFGVAAVLLLAAALVVLERRLRSFDRDLNHPDHIRELSAAIDSAWRQLGSTTTIKKTAPGFIPIQTTTLGLQLSASRISRASGEVYCWAISSRSGKLIDDGARALARLIMKRREFSGPIEMRKGRRGVFHLLIHPLNG